MYQKTTISFQNEDNESWGQNGNKGNEEKWGNGRISYTSLQTYLETRARGGGGRSDRSKGRKKTIEGSVFLWALRLTVFLSSHVAHKHPSQLFQPSEKILSYTGKFPKNTSVTQVLEDIRTSNKTRTISGEFYKIIRRHQGDFGQ